MWNLKQKKSNTEIKNKTMVNSGRGVGRENGEM
jgi:hypothetical protein